MDQVHIINNIANYLLYKDAMSIFSINKNTYRLISNGDNYWKNKLKTMYGYDIDKITFVKHNNVKKNYEFLEHCFYFENISNYDISNLRDIEIDDDDYLEYVGGCEYFWSTKACNDFYMEESWDSLYRLFPVENNEIIIEKLYDLLDFDYYGVDKKYPAYNIYYLLCELSNGPSLDTLLWVKEYFNTFYNKYIVKYGYYWSEKNRSDLTKPPLSINLNNEFNRIDTDREEIIINFYNSSNLQLIIMIMWISRCSFTELCYLYLKNNLTSKLHLIDIYHSILFKDDHRYYKIKYLEINPADRHLFHVINDNKDLLFISSSLPMPDTSPEYYDEDK